MIPMSILQYLQRSRVPYAHRWHHRAVTAQEFANSLHITGHRVAKSVLVDADGKKWIAVLAASDRVNEQLLAEALDASSVRLLGEDEFAGLFKECEVGAEPPFGKLYKLPVVLDTELTKEESLVFRAGSHEEAVVMRTEDFVRLEEPLVQGFSAPYPRVPTRQQPEARV